VHTTRSELLGDCREEPEKLLLRDNPKREPRSFLLAQARSMGKKRGKSEGSFVAETRRQATDFYRELVQGLVPPRTKAPKIREEEKPPEPDAVATRKPEKSESEVRRAQEMSLQRLAELTPFAPE
jgi:hypothetical protein